MYRPAQYQTQKPITIGVANRLCLPPNKAIIQGPKVMSEKPH